MEDTKHNTIADKCNNAEEQLLTPDIDKAELRAIALDKIKISESCRRDSYDHDNLDSLARSIAKDGLLQPAAVKEDGCDNYTLIFGSRRYLAHKQLGRKTILCYVLNTTPRKAAVLSFVENWQTEKIHPIEQARKLKLIKELFGFQEDGELAKEIGWPQSLVAEHLAVLRLPQDVLDQVGTEPESPFKFTHALALSKLERTKRLNKLMEARQLQKKIIEHRIPSSELKSLVHLFKKNHYDRLPDRLRTYLLNKKAMSSQVAMLYLEPESVVEGKTEAANRRRNIAKMLSKAELEQLIVKAVKGEWPYDKTKQKVLGMIEDRLVPTEKTREEPESIDQKLLGDISLIGRRLEACDNELSDLARSDPKRLERLLRQIKELRNKLEDFIGNTQNILDRHKVSGIAQGEETDNVSVG